MSGAAIPFCVPDGATILSAVALSRMMLHFWKWRTPYEDGAEGCEGEGGVNFFARSFSLKRDGLVAGENQRGCSWEEAAGEGEVV